MAAAPFERRARQRFITLRAGDSPFRMWLNGSEVPLDDLSVEGFSLQLSTPPSAEAEFEFVLRFEGRPGEIAGWARAVNFQRWTGSGLVGCRFVSFGGDGLARLRGWLSGHVVACSALPLSPQEAVAIVNGPSIV
ncbi:MAG: PilZ domain-containing protein [Rhodocyclaceae bacterium]|jgi:hypothetical protein|nr:PilZ domain-containing protein [Rhodocyclaceae bacterium]